MNRRALLLSATAILLLAAIARILHIGDQALWIDEGSTYSIIRLPDIASMIQALAARDHHPPVYYLLLKGWSLVMGDSVVSLRMVSALCSILSVALIYPLAREITRTRAHFDHRGVAVLAMLILALSDPEVVLAQDMRKYALRTLLTIASMLFYLRWIRRSTRKDAALWVISGALLLHTQYQGLFVCAVQGLHALIFLRGRVRIQAVALLALTGALFAPWFLLVAIRQTGNDTGIFSSLASNWDTLAVLREKFFSRQWPLMIGLLLLGMGAWVVTARGTRRFEWRPFGMIFLLVMWIVLTVTVTFFANLIYPLLAPHRILLITPAIAILIAQGLWNLPAPARSFLVAVIVIYGVTTVDDYYPKEPWDEVAAHVNAYAEEGEMVLMEIYRGDYPLIYYLDHGLPPGVPAESLRLWRDERAAEYPQGMIDMLNAHSTVWLVHWSPDLSAFDFLAQTDHTQTARFSTEHVGNLINVYRYDKLDGSAVAAYENGMILRHAAIIPPDDAGQMRVDAWWSTDTPLELDYTTSAFLLDAGGALVGQHDEFPQRSQRPTTSWQPGEVIYDPHPIDVSTLPAGTYTVALQTYTYFDGVRYNTTDGQPWFVIGTVRIGEDS